MKTSEECGIEMDGFKYDHEYNSLMLCIVDRKKNSSGIGCGYFYLVTNGGSSHTAFRTRQELRTWLQMTGLKLAKRKNRCVELEGKYSHSLEMLNTKEFFNKYGKFEPYPILENGAYTIGFAERKASGVTLHIQNSNSDRWEMDYRQTQRRLQGMSQNQAKYSK